MKFLLLIGVIGLVITSCNFGHVDTTNPQVSRNLHESKKNGLFISDYIFSVVDLQTLDTVHSKDLAWLEKVWFNITDQSSKIDVSENNQLVFNLSMLDNYRINDFIIGKNRIKGSNNYYCRIENELFTYRFRDSLIPNNLDLYILSEEDTLAIIKFKKMDL